MMEQRQRLTVSQTTSTTKTVYEATTQYYSTAAVMDQVDGSRSPRRAAGENSRASFVIANVNVNNLYIIGENMLPTASTPSASSHQLNEGGAVASSRSLSMPTDELVGRGDSGNGNTVERDAYLTLAIPNSSLLDIPVVFDKRWENEMMIVRGGIFRTICFSSNEGAIQLFWMSEFTSRGLLDHSPITILSEGDLGVSKFSIGSDERRLNLTVGASYGYPTQGVVIGKVKDRQKLELLKEHLAKAKSRGSSEIQGYFRDI